MSIIRKIFFSFYCFQKVDVSEVFFLFPKGFEKVNETHCAQLMMESHKLFSHQLTLREETEGSDTLYFLHWAFQNPEEGGKNLRNVGFLKTVKRGYVFSNKWHLVGYNFSYLNLDCFVIQGVIKLKQSLKRASFGIYLTKCTIILSQILRNSYFFVIWYLFLKIFNYLLHQRWLRGVM